MGSKKQVEGFRCKRSWSKGVDIKFSCISPHIETSSKFTFWAVFGDHCWTRAKLILSILSLKTTVNSAHLPLDKLLKLSKMGLIGLSDVKCLRIVPWGCFGYLIDFNHVVVFDELLLENLGMNSFLHFYSAVQHFLSLAIRWFHFSRVSICVWSDLFLFFVGPIWSVNFSLFSFRCQMSTIKSQKDSKRLKGMLCRI